MSVHVYFRIRGLGGVDALTVSGVVENAAEFSETIGIALRSLDWTTVLHMEDRRLSAEGYSLTGDVTLEYRVTHL